MAKTANEFRIALPEKMMPVTARCVLIALFIFLALSEVHGQELSFADSIGLYNRERIKINKAGLEVQGIWGLGNIAAGAAGYFGTKGGEGRYFAEMNGIMGIVNTGLSMTGLLMVKKQMARKLGYDEAFNWYLTDKKIYFAGAGADILIVGAGLGLDSYGQKAKNNADVYTGFGKSLVLQGVVLLLFDNIMLLEHHKNSGRWYRIMGEMQMTRNGAGLVVPVK